MRELIIFYTRRSINPLLFHLRKKQDSEKLSLLIKKVKKFSGIYGIFILLN